MSGATGGLVIIFASLVLIFVLSLIYSYFKRDTKNEIDINVDISDQGELRLTGDGSTIVDGNLLEEVKKTTPDFTFFRMSIERRELDTDGVLYLSDFYGGFYIAFEITMDRPIDKLKIKHILPNDTTQTYEYLNPILTSVYTLNPDTSVSIMGRNRFEFYNEEDVLISNKIYFIDQAVIERGSVDISSQNIVEEIPIIVPGSLDINVTLPKAPTFKVSNKASVSTILGGSEVNILEGSVAGTIVFKLADGSEKYMTINSDATRASFEDVEIDEATNFYINNTYSRSYKRIGLRPDGYGKFLLDDMSLELYKEMTDEQQQSNSCWVISE